MIWEVAWMWDFQVSLGSLGKQSCAPSRALLRSLNRSPSPAVGMRWRKTVLLQQRSRCYCTSINTQIISATYTYSTLLVSHFYTKFRHTYFLLSFLFPSLLMAEWNPRKQNKTHTPMLQTCSKMRQLLDCIWSLQLTHTAQTNTLARAGPGFRSLNSPNVTSPNLTDSKKPGTSLWLSTFATSLHQPSFLPNARYHHKVLEKRLLN